MGLILSDGDSRNIADTGALDRGGIKEAEGGGAATKWDDKSSKADS